ncbi:MAG: ABC transporter permease [Acidobacteriota bacterium]
MTSWPKLYFRLIRLFGLLVPHRLREDWLREWEAELKHRETLLAKWNNRDGTKDLLRRGLGAFWDAVWLQPQRLEDDLISDIRFGLRMLQKNPGYAAVAALTLALGIGANTAIFSIVKTVLLQPLPYTQPERLVTLWERNPLKGIAQENVSPPDLADWTAQQRVFERIAFWTGPTEFNLVQDADVIKVRAAYASSELFPTLGTAPFLGRSFLAEEDLPQGNRVALIGYDFWQNHYAGDTGVLGKTLIVDTFGRRDYTIVGVLPPRFRFPDQTEIWLPAGWNGLSRDRRGGHWLSVIARLKPEIGLATAGDEMNRIQGGIAERFGDVVIGNEVAVVPLLEQSLGVRLRPALMSLLAIVVCVLLIACANVANLSLARAGARQKEVAIRLVLGASRIRLARQLITESFLLALIGGVLGLMLAVLLVRLVVAFNRGHVPRLEEVHVDGAMLLFTLAASLVTGLLSGLAPAWQYSKPDLNSSLKDGDRSGSVGLHRSRLRGVLVVTQIALALVLLVGAGLMTRSFLRLIKIDRGFDTNRLATANIDFSVHGFTTWVQPTATRPQVALREMMERWKGIPGVRSVGAIGSLPQGVNSIRPSTFAIENHPQDAANIAKATFSAVTPDYFRTMGVPLLRGRAFTEQDILEATPVAIINETMSTRYFPGEDPIGKRIALYGRNPGELAINPLSTTPWIEVVGVVGDVRKMTLEAVKVPDVFRPYWQWPMQSPLVAIRSDIDMAGLASAMRAEVRAVSKTVPQPRVQSMDEVLSDVVAQPRFYTVLSALFGGLALLLSAIGIYGVMAYAVGQRTREIGIRIALGALPSDILRLVIGQGLKLTAIGAAIGLALAIALTRLLSALLFGLSATDPLTFAGGFVVLLGVASLACYLPARSAIAVDPMTALRRE